MEFNYYYVQSAYGTLEIEDIGNCAIEAIDTTLHALYYLIIKTNLGFTSIMEYGPLAIDMNILPKSTSCTYKRIEYSDSKLKGIIDNFLTNPKRNIDQAREIAPEEAYLNCIDIIKYMQRDDI